MRIKADLANIAIGCFGDGFGDRERGTWRILSDNNGNSTDGQRIIDHGLHVCLCFQDAFCGLFVLTTFGNRCVAVINDVQVFEHIDIKVLNITGSVAAGLLAQVDSAPYSVTKHAAVGCAEWLAIKYADKGVRVSVLCPQAVDTAMIQSRPNSPGTMSGDVLPPEAAAQAVLDGVRAEKFLILSHPVAREYMDRKHNDIDRWLRGMGRLRKKVLGEE